MSNKRQTSNCNRMTFVKLKRCDVLVLVLFTVLLTAVECAKLETQIKRLINDEDLLLEERKHAAAAADIGGLETIAEESAGDSDHERFHLYRSELKRLSYETIHRILRDENEPNYRREDAEQHYYQKRSYQPAASHEVVRRSTTEEEQTRLAVEPTLAPHYLNLSHTNLSDFPATEGYQGKDPNLITEIDLSANNLQQLNLSRFPQLQIINLSHNSLTALPLTENSSVVTLNLNGNRIKSGIVPANFHLRTLHLSSNQIENLMALNLSMLNALETLDLSCNRIQNLETAFFPQRMHNLKHLNLAHNHLATIFRETFYNLLSLNTLLLTHNTIRDIDYETFLALPNLQYLDLSYNQLGGESIRALQGIPDLVGLSIAYNPEVGASMQEFVASWSLKELDASGTGLCQIPAALAQSVRTLKLTDNWLKVINCGDLDSYPLLQYLDLSHSRIEDIEDDALGRLEILEVLFLDHNNLHKIPISLPTSLEHLFLQHNQIMDIQVQAFQALNNLQTLDLSGNKLLYLPALALPKLLTLNLQSSGLKGLSQAIVHTLPRLRDLLLEDNPIKCSDLLGIAEWASPCRIAERSSLVSEVGDGSSNSNGEQIANSDVGQQQQQLLVATKIDLKQKFVQMHNFFEKFRSNCGFERQMIAQELMPMPTPTCAIELDADNAAATITEAPNEKTKVISFNFPNEPPTENTNTNANTNAKPNSNASLKAKVFGSNQKNFTTEIKESLQESANNMAAAAPAATTPTIILTENTTNNSINSTESSTAVTAQTLQQTVATSSLTPPPPQQQQQHITELLPTLTTTRNPTATSTDIENANQDEPKTRRTTQTFSGQNSVATTTTAATKATVTPTTTRTEAMATSTAAAINFEKQQPTTAKTTAQTELQPTPTRITSTSSLNNSERISKLENVDTTTVTTAMKTVQTTREAAPTTHVPQTIPTTIKSGNNYVETTSLLNQKGFKTSAASTETTPTETATITTTTTAVIDKDLAHNDNNNVVANKQQNNFKRANPSFNGISGQLNINAEPTTEKTILASQPHQSVAEPTVTLTTTTAANTPPPHKHEPLQLHIKDRHLIGTPLLMHKGQNILVEAVEQLMWPVTNANAANKALTTMRPLAGRVATSYVPKATTPTIPTTVTSTAAPGKGSEANILAKSQTEVETETKWLRDITGLTETDKNFKAEAINEATNEHKNTENTETYKEDGKENVATVGKLATYAGDKQMMEDGTKVVKTKAKQLELPEDSDKAIEIMKTTAKYPKKLADKKKPSLTMKKMTIIKHSNPHKQQQHYQHSLNTPRENEASVHDFDAKLFTELKPANEEEKQQQRTAENNIKIAMHKHSTVNTPINDHHHLHQEVNTFAEQEHASELIKNELSSSSSEHERVSQSEQWLDIRKATGSGHPGIVILLSFSLFVVLLVGLMHVYRCDMPWRRHLPQQRPHQRHLNDDDAHSFLNYHNTNSVQQLPNANIQKWHHSTRLQPPYSSPLHNLHVRELQKTSAVEEKSNRCKQFYSASMGTANYPARTNSDASHSSSLTSSSHSSAILEDDAFYIEMTPDSGQSVGNLHSDLLPMELLSGVTATVTSRRSLNGGDMIAFNDLMGTATTSASTSANTTTTTTTTIPQSSVTAELGLFNGETVGADVDDDDNYDERQAKVAPSARKFGLW